MRAIFTFTNRRYRVPVCRTIIFREQMISEQGCLERALHTGTRHLFRGNSEIERVAHFFCARAFVQDVSILSREPLPAPSNIKASELAINNKAHW